MSRYAHVQHNIKEPSVIHLIINIFVKRHRHSYRGAVNESIRRW